MSTKAFVLIETAVGKTRDVVNTIAELPGMKSVDAVTGPYDAIAVLEGTDLAAVGNLVTQKIHTAEGVIRTVTCLAVT